MESEQRATAHGEAASQTQQHYRQDKMARELGWYASFSVAFGFVSIATGIFTTYGAVLNSSGPRGIWAWPIAVLGQLGVALIFGALAALLPITGYAYQWVSRVANPVWGWISFSFLGVVVVAVDYTIAAAILPELIGYAGTAQNAWAITAVVILAQAVLVALSTRATNRVNEVAVTVQIIGMIALTVLLFVVGGLTGKLDFSTLFAAAPVPSEGYWRIGNLTHAGPFPLAFLLGAFTIVGFESAANLAEETRDPARGITRAPARWRRRSSRWACSGCCSWSPSPRSPAIPRGSPSPRPRWRP